MAAQPSLNLSDRVLTLEEGQKALHADVQSIITSIGSLRSEIVALAQRQSEGQKTNWPMLLTIAAMVMTLLGAAWKLVELQTAVALAPIQQQNSSSIVDRKDLGEKTYNLQVTMAGIQTVLSSEIAERRAHEVEFESQFRSQDNIRSLQWAEHQRFMNLLWEKTWGTHYPSEVQFFPSVSRDIGNGNGQAQSIK